MAFEQTPPPPQTPTPPPKRRFDSAAFYGLVIGVVILAAVIFFFRDAIAAKIAEWRGSGSSVVTVAPVVPTVSPAPTTPTPTATAVPTPKATVTPKPTAPTIKPTATGSGGTIPTTGPADDLLVMGIAGGGLAAGSTTLRYHYLRRKLKQQISKIDIV
jgi:hypothetical protein